MINNDCGLLDLEVLSSSGALGTIKGYMQFT